MPSVSTTDLGTKRIDCAKKSEFLENLILGGTGIYAFRHE
jgi:hypothetical protein